MHFLHLVRTRGMLALTLVCLFAPHLAAHAASVTVSGMNPASGVKPGATITFSTNAYGFADPKFTLSDSYSSPSSSITNADIDISGFFSWTPLATDAGRHAVTVTVTDASGAQASTTANLLVIANTLLVENLLPGTTVYTNNPVTFTVTTPGFTAPWFTVSDSYAGTSVTNENITSDGAFSWTPRINEQGVHKLMITARDSYGHAATLEQYLTVAPSALLITNLSPGTTVAVGTPLTFSASTTGFANPTFTTADSLGRYSSVSATSTATTTNAGVGLFSWTPRASDLGTHVITVSAMDANGASASAAQTITVVATTAQVAAAPAIAAPTAQMPAVGAAATPAAPASAYTFTKSLALGSRGTEVTALQNRITELGFYNGPVTGYYGPLTAAGVKRFQAAHGIEQAGFVGPQTRRALNAQ